MPSPLTPYRGGVDLLNGIGTLMLVINVAALALGVFDVIDVAIRPAEGFVAAGKLTSGLAGDHRDRDDDLALVHGLLSLLGIPALVALLVYLVDVRPAVRAVSGGRPPRHLL